MRARDRNSFMNRACRELMGAQRRIAQAQAEGGIIGLVKRRMAETELTWLRVGYRQNNGPFNDLGTHRHFYTDHKGTVEFTHINNPESFT